MNALNLVFLPCGCVVTAETTIEHIVDEHIIQCPWCSAVFDTDDVQRWAYYCLSENVTPMAHYYEPRTMFLHWNDLVQVTGKRCQCGTMLLREYDTGEIRHPTPDDPIQRVWS